MNIKTYWHNLNEREQWLVGLGGIFCFCVILYLLIFAPLQRTIKDKTQILLEKQETYQWLQQAKAGFKSNKKPLSTSKLLAIFAGQLNSNSLRSHKYQLEQTGSGDIKLFFDSVPYNAFIKWLWSANQTYAFTIKKFTTERTDTAGMVKAILIFKGL